MVEHVLTDGRCQRVGDNVCRTLERMRVFLVSRFRKSLENATSSVSNTNFFEHGRTLAPAIIKTYAAFLQGAAVKKYT